MNVSLVPLANIDAIWPHIAVRVTKCLVRAPSETTAADFWMMCRNGTALLILVMDDESVVAITIWRFSGLGYFECLMIEGKRPGSWLKPLLNCALQVSSDHGLKGIAGIGRPGWFNLLKKHFPQAKTPRLMYTVEFEK